MEPMQRDEALQLLSEAPVAHLGVLSEGEPYVTPLSFVLQDDRIVFRTQAGRKLRAIRANPRVCIEVSRFDEQTGDWASVIVWGTASETGDPRAGELTVQMLFTKYAVALGSPLSHGGLHPMPGLPHIVEVRIEEISGMTSGRQFSPRTRPGRL